jgi:hypothetical protein
VLVTVAAIGLVLAASRSGRTATVTPVTTASPAPAMRSPTPGPSAAEASARPGEIPDAPLPVAAFLALVVAALVALVGYAAWTWLRQDGGGGLVRRRRRPPHRPPPPVPDRPAVESFTEAVEVALRRLDEGEPADAVVACWVQLEQAAAEAGTARRPSETPAQLVTRVLAQHLVTRETLERLVGLYREARYSRHVLGPGARAEARMALERLRGELTAEGRVQ